MKKVVAGLLLVSVLGAGIGLASPSHATDWKKHEADRIAEQNKRRAEELAKAKSEQEARDKARRIYYEEQRRKEFERKLEWEKKRSK